MTRSCQRAPTISICKGMRRRMVSRSSKMARMRALRNTQVAVKPAAASMEKRTPADVGEAKRLTRRDSVQRWKLSHNCGGAITKTKYTAQKSHGKAAAV